MKITLAQLNPVVGAFEENVKKIKDAYEIACRDQARLLLTPELVLCGYPHYDWIERPEFLEQNLKALDDVLQLTHQNRCAIALGHVQPWESTRGKPAQNVVSLLENGQVVFRQAKSLLPTYDVFDEERYFEPSHAIQGFDLGGVRTAFAICEDLWGEDRSLSSRQHYSRDPLSQYEALGTQCLFSLSASPYEWGKRERRENVHQEVVKRLGVPLVYVNQVGATDEVLFDGSSFCMDAQGQLLARLPAFESCVRTVTLSSASSAGIADPDAWSVLTQGLIVGIRDYFHRTGFKKAIVGLSGGIDSAVVAVLAVQALGAQNVLGVAMPSQYSSSHSLEDAESLAKNLQIPFQVKPIKFLNSTAMRELGELRGGVLSAVALENLQSRLRGMILMTLSNHDSALVLTTGNKSEIAMGYCTLYGDMNGALGPIGDLYKTQVYDLARHLNQVLGGVIPERTLTKAPSAELRPNQTDQDSLPPYEVLDSFLKKFIEKNLSIEDLQLQFSGLLPEQGRNSVLDLVHRFHVNEYKRKQAPPLLRVSSKAFGLGRRVPIAKKW